MTVAAVTAGWQMQMPGVAIRPASRAAGATSTPVPSTAAEQPRTTHRRLRRLPQQTPDRGASRCGTAGPAVVPGVGEAAVIRRDALREYSRGSLWLLPVVSVVLALLLGALLSRVPVPPGSPLAFQGTADDARALLIGITGTMVTVIALLLGLAAVALQLSSTQFSPGCCATSCTTVTGRSARSSPATPRPRSPSSCLRGRSPSTSPSASASSAATAPRNPPSSRHCCGCSRRYSPPAPPNRPLVDDRDTGRTPRHRGRTRGGRTR